LAPEHRKRTELAAELIKLLASWLPEECRLEIVGDSESACKTSVRGLPENQHFTGPMSMDAALDDEPGEYSGRGRKPVFKRVSEKIRRLLPRWFLSA